MHHPVALENGISLQGSSIKDEQVGNGLCLIILAMFKR